MEVQNLFEEYFGKYEPVTYEKTEIILLPDGTTEHVEYKVIPDGLAGVDYPYVLSILLFMIVCVAIFRFLASGLRSLFGVVS